MSGYWRSSVIVIALSAALLAGSSPVQAHSFCQVVSVPVTTGGFALTPLDAWAFVTVPAAPMMTTVRQIVVCQPFTVTPVLTPVMFAPPVFFVDPPSTPPHVGGAAGRTPVPASEMSGVVPPVTVRDLAQNPAQYDRQVVSLEGNASVLRTSYAASGTRYTEIRLESGGASIVAVAWGTPKVDAGERVHVTGNFYAHAPFALAPGSPIHNVLEAVTIETIQ